MLVLLALLGASPPRPPVVDFCTLAAHPPEYRGRRVEVSGYLLAGFEAFRLSGTCGSDQRERICLAMADWTPTSISRGHAAPAEEIDAIAEVALLPTLVAVEEEGFEKVWSAIPWVPVRYEPLSPKRNRMWRRFLKVIEKERVRDTTVTLRGRFEYVNGPSMVRYGETVSELTGYGHMGIECQARVVIEEVVAVKAVQSKRGAAEREDAADEGAGHHD